MKLLKWLPLATALCIMLALGGKPAQAQAHPAYLHALSDLRLMRAYLDHTTPDPVINDETTQAIAEIDACMKEIKAAAFDDGKNLNDHPPVDTRIQPAERYRKARQAGDAVWNDLNQEEDNNYAQGLKHRAMDHLGKANHIVDHIIKRYEGQ